MVSDTASSNSKIRVLHLDDEDGQLIFAKEFIEELGTQIKKGNEPSHWEKRNQQITKDLENTKNMQQEIRTQLRQFIEQPIKNK